MTEQLFNHNRSSKSSEPKSFSPFALEAQVWFCFTNMLLVELYSKLMQSLSGSEKDRAQAIQRQSQQQAYIVAHVLLRFVLSQQLKCSMSDLRFQSSKYGKPQLLQACGDGRLNTRHIHFNISHTDGLVAVAIANAPIGVDVEQRLVKDPLLLAKAHMAPTEYVQIQQAQNSQQLFRQYWVAKESVVKALGVGLNQPLNHFEVIKHGAFAANKWHEVAWTEQPFGKPPASAAHHVVVQRIEQDAFMGEGVQKYDAAMAAVMPALSSTGRTEITSESQLILQPCAVHWIDCVGLLEQVNACPKHNNKG